MKRKHIGAGTVVLLALAINVAGLSFGCSKNSAGPQNGCVDENGNPLPTKHDSLRVDLAVPMFSDPLDISNPLFPISSLHSAVLLGTVDGERFRVEVTLLPASKTINLDGGPVQTLESQYVAFIDGRLEEVALDWYAQDDVGAVWYLGEDVFNYADGVLADIDGTWQAGEDGPAAMIMPANPKVGNVYRPENICGEVFEEVEVKTIGQTVNGPRGPVAGAITVEELHMDGTYEDKTFAPGYGEFSTGSGANLEAIALAVPIDALAGGAPATLEAIVSGANDIFEAAEASNWTAASAAMTSITAAWNTYQAGSAPPRLRTQMVDALALLQLAVNAQHASDTREAAIDVARSTHDFRLRYQPITEIDIARFELWLRQILVDADEDDAEGIKGDVTTLEWVRDRFAHTLGGSVVSQIDALLADLRAAADGEDLGAAAGAAQELRDLIAGLQ